MKKIVISSFFLIGIALFLSLDGEKLLQELKQELEKTEEKLFEKDKKLPAPIIFLVILVLYELIAIKINLEIEKVFYV